MFRQAAAGSVIPVEDALVSTKLKMMMQLISP